MEQFEKMDVVMTPAMALPAQPIKAGVDAHGRMRKWASSTMADVRTFRCYSDIEDAQIYMAFESYGFPLPHCDNQKQQG